MAGNWGGGRLQVQPPYITLFLHMRIGWEKWNKTFNVIDAGMIELCARNFKYLYIYHEPLDFFFFK